MRYILCTVIDCLKLYEAHHQNIECPDCGTSEAEILSFKTNDLSVINKKKLDRDIHELYNDALGG